jgi:ABC-type uncharacterized transport system substrate-binding protein
MSNVISIFDRKKDKSKELKELLDQETIEDSPENTIFDNVVEANNKRKEKLKQDREKVNKSVLRSFRIKND